ncbi:MAG: CxxC-x17-CxxC domain-containing protein, partial [Patescibacteria group bacterium]
KKMFNNDNNRGGGNFGQRPMVQGNWKCSDCGTEITQLPFEPIPGRDILCRDCYRKKNPQKFNR